MQEKTQLQDTMVGPAESPASVRAKAETVFAEAWESVHGEIERRAEVTAETAEEYANSGRRAETSAAGAAW